jgi:hypothetical protein
VSERSARADERVKREPKVPAMVPCLPFVFAQSELPSRNAVRMGRSHHWLAPGCGDRTHARRSTPPTPAARNSRDRPRRVQTRRPRSVLKRWIGPRTVAPPTLWPWRSNRFRPAAGSSGGE